MRKLKLFLSLLMLFTFSVGTWAASPVTVTSTFTKATAPSSNQVTDLEGVVTWDIATTVGQGAPAIATSSSNNKDCLKFGSSKSVYFSRIVFSTDYFKDYNVTSVKINVVNNGKKTGTFTAKQGSTTIGSESKEFGNSGWTELTATGTSGSGGTLQVIYEVAQASYWSTIAVTYETSGGSCTSEITITKADDPENGTFTIDNSGTVCIDEGNATVNVTATPAAHYHLATVTSTVGTVGTISGNTCEITDIDEDTEIGVTFAENEKFQVTWNVNGNEDTKTNVYAGEKPVFPATPAACDATSTTFIGWATAPWTGKLADLSEKTVYTSANAMPDVDAAVTYYAVFAKSSGSASNLFSWAGGTKAELAAAEGVEDLSADNSDYAVENAPYRVKWNGTGKYIIISVASQPGKVSAGFKMIGGATTSTITVQEADDAEGPFTDVENLAISGSSNDVVNIESTQAFKSTTRAIKLYYTKGSNVGLGPISIEGAVSMSDYMTTCCTKYAINIATSIENGSVSADPASACEGETVTLTFTPATNYHLSAWTLNGTAQDIAENTFEMPGEAVTVSATFAQDACDPLSTPSVTVSGKAYPYDAVQLAWTAIEHADAYKVYIYDNEDNELEHNDAFAGVEYTIGQTLSASTTYKYSVQAISNTPATYCPSTEAENTFTTDALPTAHLTLIDLEGEHAESGDHPILTPFALPSTAATCSKTFMGWDADENCATAPTYAKGAEFTFANTTTVTLYAVYADVTPGATSTTNIAYTGSTTSTLADGENEADVFGLNESDWSVISHKHSANTVGVNKDGTIRLYYNADGNTSLEIIAPQTITSVGVTCKTNNDNIIVKVGDNTITLEDGVYAINATSFEIVNGYTSNTQVHITNIAINFTAPGTTSNYSTTCVSAELSSISLSYSAVESWKGEALPKPVVTAHFSAGAEDQIVTNEATFSTFDATQVGEQEITVSYEYEGVEKSATYTVTVKTIANDAAHPYSVAEAIALIDAGKDLSTPVYVCGKVNNRTFFSNSGSFNVWVKDELTDEASFEFYKFYKDSEQGQFTAESDIAEKDSIVGYGTLTKFNSTYEFAQNCYLISRVAYTELTFDAETGKAYLPAGVKDVVLPTLTKSEEALEVSYSSSNEAVAEVNASTGAITPKTAGTTIITASYAGDATHQAAEDATYTLTVYAPTVVITGTPQLAYEYNDVFSFSGLGAKAVYGDASEYEIPSTGLVWTSNPVHVTENGKVQVTVTWATIESEAREFDVTVLAHELTFNATPEHGTVSVVYNDNPVATGDHFVKGDELTITATPASADYALTLLTVNGDAFVSGDTYEVGTVNIAVEATFTEKSAAGINWSESAVNVTLGDTYVLPTLNNEQTLAVTYSSDNTDVATISNEEGHEGEITIKAVGTTTISAEFAGNDIYKASTVSYTLTVTCATLPEPTVTVSNISLYGADFSWDAVANADGYYLEVALYDDPTDQKAMIGGLTPEELSYSVHSLEAGTHYTYFVKAFNNDEVNYCNGGWSVATTGDFWTDPYYITGSFNGWTMTPMTADSFVFENLEVGTPYEIKVSIDGTFDNGKVKGFADLTPAEMVAGLYSGTNDNIVFTLAKAGKVVVTYNQREFKVVGEFVAQSVELAGYCAGNWDWDSHVQAKLSDDRKSATAKKTFNKDEWVTFKMVVDSKWMGTSGDNYYLLTRDDNSVSGLFADGKNQYFQADKTGEYEFTWTFGTNAVTVKFPDHSYTVAWTRNGTEDVEELGTLVRMGPTNQFALTMEKEPAAATYTVSLLADGVATGYSKELVIEEHAKYELYFEYNPEAEQENDRFTALASKIGIATEIGNTGDGQKAVKVMKDNTIYIIRGDKTYTITGQVVK